MDDAGPSEEARALAERFGARYEPHSRPLGLNVARNTGVERSTGELVVFVDDDVEVCEGWLDALLTAADEHPEREVFTGPILPRLEGSPPHSCGREEPPITALDLGPDDTPTRFAWGANMAIRRTALERVGAFDVSLEYGGDEQEWQERLFAEPASRNGSVAGTRDRAAGSGNATASRSICGARRAPSPAQPCRRAPAVTVPGRLRARQAARRFDAWRRVAPSVGRELRHARGLPGPCRALPLPRRPDDGQPQRWAHAEAIRARGDEPHRPFRP